jgi:DNA-binding LytR/AlgR family response regulator
VRLAEADNGADAVARFEQFAPDLVFLDIKIPVLGGIEAARLIGDRALVVFVTAYDEFAVDVFRRGSIDYLLKPIDAERLAQEALAHLAGIERSHMGKIERGEHMPTLVLILKIARALGRSSGELMLETEARLSAIWNQSSDA